SRGLLVAFGIAIEPVTLADAEAAALLWKKGDVLSLADRLCLAAGARLGARIFTCDKAWAGREGVVVLR
ncbi:MAG TPA: PIN domain-containing protein, partial [Galbitalea sp.]